MVCFGFEGLTSVCLVVVCVAMFLLRFAHSAVAGGNTVGARFSHSVSTCGLYILSLGEANFV